MTKPIPELTDKQIARFWSRIDVRGADECWPWKGSADKNGYGQFGAAYGCYRAHRVSMAIDGRDPLEFCALHRCDNPPCCNPSHLFAGTSADNIADRSRKGRASKGASHWTVYAPEKLKRGETNGNSKITADIVRAIRIDNRKNAEISKAFNISKTQVFYIKTRRAWAHIH